MHHSFDSLYKLTDYPNYKVIIVENGSTKDCVEYSNKRYKKADVLWIEKGRGFPGGMNFGMKYSLKKSNPEYVLLLNNDTEIIQKDWLTKLVDEAEKNPKTGVIGAKFMNPNNIEQVSSVINFTPLGYIEYKGNAVKEVQWVSGAAFLIKTDVIKEIGFLNERYNPGYYEETEFFFRCRENGYKIITVPYVKIFHVGAATWDKRASEEKMFVIYRNQIMFFLTHLPARYLLGRTIKSLVVIFLTNRPKLIPVLIKGYLAGLKQIRLKPTIW